MASAKEIEKELAVALKEVGKIQPWFDAELNEWVFSNSLYPVECGGNTPEEAAKKYPMYLREFIKQRLNNNLDPFVEKKTKGQGGCRPGAGRPKNAAKELKGRIYLPLSIANWLKNPQNLLLVENLRQKHC